MAKTSTSKTAAPKEAAPKTTRKTTASAAPEPKITFEFFAPNAKAVAVAGSFNNWQPDQNRLKKDKDGKWKGVVPLSPGRYEYRYVVDGSWQNDPKPAECVANPYGGTNCVITVPQSTR